MQTRAALAFQSNAQNIANQKAITYITYRLSSGRPNILTFAKLPPTYDSARVDVIGAGHVRIGVQHDTRVVVRQNVRVAVLFRIRCGRGRRVRARISFVRA